jgi:hypothetical protein
MERVMAERATLKQLRADILKAYVAEQIKVMAGLNIDQTQCW